MNRRTLICGLGALATGLSSGVRAQSPRSNAPSREPWKEIPSITVVSAEDDSRLSAVREAVDFWNGEFSRLGSPFRLGAIVPVVGVIPVEDLYLSLAGMPTPPESIRGTNGDMIVALSEANINSFTAGWRVHQKVLIAIQSLRRYPLTVSGGARNVIAHEFGHAIGLGHNNDENTLMCGKQSPWCHFVFPGEGFFPLTSAEEANTCSKCIRRIGKRLHPEGGKWIRCCLAGSPG